MEGFGKPLIFQEKKKLSEKSLELYAPNSFLCMCAEQTENMTLFCLYAK